MSSGIARQKLRLFIGAVEFPIISCTVQSAVGSPSTAATEVPPHDAFHDIAPRTSIQVFYYDGADKTHRMVDGGYEYTDVPMDSLVRYKLLHNGILRGYGSSRSRAGGWQTTLHSTSPTIIYDSIQQYYGGYKDGGSAKQDMDFLGASAKGRRQFRSRKLSGSQAPSEVYNVIREGAALYGDNWVMGLRLLFQQIAFNAHPFWETEFKRLRVSDMVVGFGHDRTSDRLMPLKKFKKLLKDNLSFLSARASIREVANYVLSYIAHTWWEMPCPYLSLKPVSKPGEESTILAPGGPVYGAYPDAELVSAFIIPDLWWASPPTCNILFPDHYWTFETSRDYLNEATRVFMHSDVDIRSQQTVRKRSYAPRFKDMDMFFTDPDLPTDFNARNAQMQLPWEKFTGPIPNIHQISTVPSKVKTEALLQYMDHIANFDFWSIRLERSASVMGPFNPNVVAGLPGAVIRTPCPGNIPDDMVPGAAKYPYTGTNRRDYYPQIVQGRISGVMHSITQTSAVTSIQMDKTRFHDEDFDLDGSSGDDLESLIMHSNDSADDDLRFFSKSYNYSNIGEDIYEPLLGCGGLYQLAGSSLFSATQELLDWVAWQYSETKAASDGAPRKMIQRVTARPVADLLQIFGTTDFPDEAEASDGVYSPAGFLYTALATKVDTSLDYMTHTKAKKGLKSAQAVTVDQEQLDKIVKINKERQDTAIKAQDLLEARVFRG